MFVTSEDRMQLEGYIKCKIDKNKEIMTIKKQWILIYPQGYAGP